MQTGKIYKGTTLISGGGSNGKDGASAYEIWLAAGNTGTTQDFLESLKGDTGVVIDEQTFMGTIVNDLTTGGANKALSAQMGVSLLALILKYPDIADCEEDGILFVDENLNIGAIIDSRGVVAINTLNYEEV